MTEQEFQVEQNIIIKTCIHCGVRYAAPAQFFNDRRKDHKSFYCPGGHAMHFPHETEEEILGRCLDYARDRLDSCQINSRTLDYRARYYKGRLTMLQKNQGGNNGD